MKWENNERKKEWEEQMKSKNGLGKQVNPMTADEAFKINK